MLGIMRRRFVGRRALIALVAVSAVTLAGCLPAGAPAVRCAPANINGWNHYETQFTRGFRPTAAWPIVDGANASIVYSPVGDAESSFAFAADPFGTFGTPNDILNRVFINPPFGPPSITNIQVVAASGVYGFAGGIAQDYEIVGTNSFELAGPGTAIRAFITALVVQNQFVAWWVQAAHAGIFEVICGVLASIRTTMSRIPQAPPGL